MFRVYKVALPDFLNTIWVLRPAVALPVFILSDLVSVAIRPFSAMKVYHGSTVVSLSTEKSYIVIVMALYEVPLVTVIPFYPFITYFR